MEILIYRLTIAVLLGLWVTTVLFWRLVSRLNNQHDCALMQEYSRSLKEARDLKSRLLRRD